MASQIVKHFQGSLRESMGFCQVYIEKMKPDLYTGQKSDIKWINK